MFLKEKFIMKINLFLLVLVVGVKQSLMHKPSRPRHKPINYLFTILASKKRSSRIRVFVRCNVGPNFRPPVFMITKNF